MLIEIAHSFEGFKELVVSLENTLSVADEPQLRSDRFWYRGIDNGAYTLTPSLYRYRDPIEKERLLFNLHGQCTRLTLGEKLVSWERVIHMQHYNIPTRLLDWTTSLWIAVFFALTASPNQPCIYILNPLRLNRESNQDGLIPVPTDNCFDFEEHFFGNPVLSPQKPLAIIPVVTNDRLNHQYGRFTVQGRNFEPLENQAPECLAKITLHEASHKQLRTELFRTGINEQTVFPDHEGVAQFVKAEARLNLIPYDESIASRIRDRLYDRAKHDIYALTHRDKNIEPYCKGITFCNIDEAYLKRDIEVGEVTTWLKDGPPFLFIIGEAGVGKTNFTLHTMLCLEGFREKPSVFFSFKLYGSGLSQVRRNDGSSELAGYIYEIMLSHVHTEQERFVARQMIAEGDVILALDGLDELARIRGEDAVEEIGHELDALFGESQKARVIITCRDRILTRLAGTGALGMAKSQRKLHLHRFSDNVLRHALERQLGAIPASLIEMACVPLFYEMIRRARDLWPKLLDAGDNRTKLEEVWFKVILDKNRYSHLNLHRLGIIAGKMLHDRSDIIVGKSIPDELIALLRALSIYPFALFVEEFKDNYSFSHQSLREFVLAWCVAKEIRAQSFELLKSSSSFDYEGHEFYDRIRDLLDIKCDVIERLRRLLIFDGLNEDERNHLIRNVFEMIGELAPSENEIIERITKVALPLLKPTITKAGYINYKTRYNIVRCLERIHWSAPRPYIDHIISLPWWRNPKYKPAKDEAYLYPFAIRGFHRPKQVAASSPPMVYKKLDTTKTIYILCKLETMVSDALILAMERISEFEIPEDGIFLGINCTHALIRWLPMNPDLDRIERLLQWRHIDWRMKQNLFYALFIRYGAKIPVRFQKGGYFNDAGDLDHYATGDQKVAFRNLKLVDKRD